MLSKAFFVHDRSDMGFFYTKEQELSCVFKVSDNNQNFKNYL